MKAPFDCWAIYSIDAVNKNKWTLIALVKTEHYHGFSAKELIKAGLSFAGPEPRVFTHNKGDELALTIE